MSELSRAHIKINSIRIKNKNLIGWIIKWRGQIKNGLRSGFRSGTASGIRGSNSKIWQDFLLKSLLPKEISAKLSDQFEVQKFEKFEDPKLKHL